MEYRYIEINGDAIVDESFLLNHLGLSKSFINKHSKEMGVFKRSPRLYFLSNVLNFLKQRAEENQRAVVQREISKSVRKFEVNRMFEEIKNKHNKKEKGGKHEREKQKKL